MKDSKWWIGNSDTDPFDEPTDRDVEALARVLHSEVPGIECSHAEFIPCEHDARVILCTSCGKKLPEVLR